MRLVPDNHGMSSGSLDVGKLDARNPERERKALLTLGSYAVRKEIEPDECLELIHMLGLAEPISH